MHGILVEGKQRQKIQVKEIKKKTQKTKKQTQTQYKKTKKNLKKWKQKLSFHPASRYLSKRLLVPRHTALTTFRPCVVRRFFSPSPSRSLFSFSNVSYQFYDGHKCLCGIGPGRGFSIVYVAISVVGWVWRVAPNVLRRHLRFGSRRVGHPKITSSSS